MLLVWLGFALAIVGGVVLVARAVAGGSSAGSRAEPGEGPGRALEILAERYARGEIDAEEFEQRKRLLRS